MAEPTPPFASSEGSPEHSRGVETPSRAKSRDGTGKASPKAQSIRAYGLGIALFVFILDQVTKYVIRVPLQLQQREKGLIELLPFFDLRWTENRGVSMGYLAADTDLMRWLLIAFTGAIALFVAVWMWREKRRDDVIGLGLVLGGALGNILDRARFGYVIDFLDLHFGEIRPFLVFNVADAAITIGVLLLLVRALLMRDKGDKKKES
jgi:signal peptidase II